MRHKEKNRIIPGKGINAAAIKCIIANIDPLLT